jgi:drug/metabolite transporter (DMT)-like permease
MWGATSLVEAPINLPQRPLTWLAVLWLGVMGVGVAYLLYFHLLHSVGPTRTLLVTYVFPLVGVLLGVIFLKESLDWNLGLGAGLVVGSIAMVNRHG